MRRNVTNKEVENNVTYLLSNMGTSGGASLKTFTFEGSGDIFASNTINLPTDCNIILGIHAHGIVEENEFDIYTGPLFLSNGVMKVLVTGYSNGEFEDGFEINMLHSFNNHQMTFKGIDDGNAFAYPLTFTLYYI